MRAAAIERPGPRRRARPEGGAPVGGIVCLAACLGLAFLLLRSGAVGEPPASPAPLATDPAPPPDWIPIPRPAPLFALAAPELRGLTAGHAARRHREGGREDVLTFGVFSGDGLHLRLVVRAGDPEPVPASFFVDLVRHAAGAGYAVTRSGAPDSLPTKFGQVEVADVAVEEAVERTCIAFRSEHPEADLRLGGWACGTPERPADRQLLACLVDRLSLRPGNDQAALKAFFAAADERRLPACHGRTSWLEAPVLRGSVANARP